jgi:hypothetical protein
MMTEGGLVVAQPYLRLAVWLESPWHQIFGGETVLPSLPGLRIRPYPFPVHVVPSLPFLKILSYIYLAATACP